MRLIFARTARRPIAHALHPIHIGGYFLHCIILYDYLLNSYKWDVFENVDFACVETLPSEEFVKNEAAGGLYFFDVLTPRNCLCISLSHSPN